VPVAAACHDPSVLADGKAADVAATAGSGLWLVVREAPHGQRIVDPRADEQDAGTVGEHAGVLDRSNQRRAIRSVGVNVPQADRFAVFDSQ
jgi:hypothetical protein